MSDGPHRSLNMRPHWKLSAQRAANLAHTAEEVCEAMTFALKKDILEAPIAAVREIMNSDTLFTDMRLDQLEALRARSPRSAATNTLIDCAVEAAATGIKGEAGTAAAVAAALEEIARPAMRGIDEHYQREAGARASRSVRARLDEAHNKLDCAGIARELLSPARPPSRRSIRTPRRTGLGEGPRL
ncbi:hypothetical protein PZ895_14320 [Mesorhizobium sp. YIM 152430]|uniref:hypothetical protein n=1 Tax=Mesorhizobium sp. YIM 152430 TaxID=3031761 RepID=UPI0023DB5DC2|nr:hypothetical protein [Mesorhizobium sp. YIM 152430]MDF1600934.1 hypothetical protein [Mesorhizobium sp. YIM 152430]